MTVSTPQITRLANGFTIVSLAMPGIETAAVALDADTGSRHEAGAEHGLAHLFEHMLFKGTASRSARDIAEQIEDVGGSLNAWTSREMTVFHARVLGDDVPLATELIADLVRAPRFDEAELEKEREVILSEIGEALDTPDDLVFDHMQETAYHGQALGRTILGTPQSLAGLGRQALSGWLSNRYRAPSLVLTAAGKVDHDALLRHAERLFADLAADAPPPFSPAHWQGGSRLDQKRGEQLHVVLAHAGPEMLAPELHAAQLFTMALGGGMSSRLFQELREEHGLVYSVSASLTPHMDSGILSLYLATQPADGARALDLLRTVAADTAHTLDTAELDRARAQMKAGWLMGLEGPAGQADWLGRSWLCYGRVVPATEMIAKLDAVTVETARAAGRQMLASAPVLAAVGPQARRLAA